MGSDNHIEQSEVRLVGVSISPGVAFGLIHLINPILSALAEVPVVGASAVRRELSKLEMALQEVRNTIAHHVREYHSIAERDFEEILSAHLLILDDRVFFSAINDKIRSDHITAERAIYEAFSETAGGLQSADDPYLRGRAEDLRDICQSIRLVLIHGPRALSVTEQDTRKSVIFSFNIYPSDVLRARRSKAIAFVTSCKASTSHGAILLRASAIPAIGGIELPDQPLVEETPVLVDVDHGEIVLWPKPETIQHAFDRSQSYEKLGPDLHLPPADAKTKDGFRVALWANIDNPTQISQCFRHRLRGIGLFRTEFMALEYGRIPDESEQYKTYLDVIDRLEGRPLIIRTFDIGADKVVVGLDECSGHNPALGVRGIRRHLTRHPEELRTQIRAIMRASVNAQVSILFPMITNTGDVQRAKEIVEQVVSELERAGTPFNQGVKLGAMVEVPSAALVIESILQNVDFVSIGTNDLLQYLTASDRDNTAVIEYQNPETSGLFQLMKHIIDEARGLGKDGDIHVCGDLASDPDAAVNLVRMGFLSLSINPAAAPRVRHAIENL